MEGQNENKFRVRNLLSGSVEKFTVHSTTKIKTEKHDFAD